MQIKGPGVPTAAPPARRPFGQDELQVVVGEPRRHPVLAPHRPAAGVTEAAPAVFLAFSRARANDLGTAVPAVAFPGLKPGDRWCLGAARWKEVLGAGVAPRVVLRATHQEAPEYVSLDDLERHALDLA